MKELKARLFLSERETHAKKVEAIMQEWRAFQAEHEERMLVSWLATHDMDGDGLKDIVTGKTYWSHHKQSPQWDAGAVVYWFKLVRSKDGVDFVPQRADTDSGLGRQVSIGDVNGDGFIDLEEMTQYPGTSLNRATYHAITSHRMNSSHTKQATPRRAFRKTDFLKFVPCDTLYAVVICKQAVNKDSITLQQLADTAILTTTKKVSK